MKNFLKNSAVANTIVTTYKNGIKKPIASLGYVIGIVLALWIGDIGGTMLDAYVASQTSNSLYWGLRIMAFVFTHAGWVPLFNWTLRVILDSIKDLIDGLHSAKVQCIEIRESLKKLFS